MVIAANVGHIQADARLFPLAVPSGKKKVTLQRFSVSLPVWCSDDFLEQKNKSHFKTLDFAPGLMF